MKITVPGCFLTYTSSYSAWFNNFIHYVICHLCLLLALSYSLTGNSRSTYLLCLLNWFLQRTKKSPKTSCLPCQALKACWEVRIPVLVICCYLSGATPMSWSCAGVSGSLRHMVFVEMSWRWDLRYLQCIRKCQGGFETAEKHLPRLLWACFLSASSLCLVKGSKWDRNPLCNSVFLSTFQFVSKRQFCIRRSVLTDEKGPQLGDGGGLTSWPRYITHACLSWGLLTQSCLARWEERKEKWQSGSHKWCEKPAK